MKKRHEISVKIPEGIDCTYSDNLIECKKGDKYFSEKVNLPGTKIEVSDGKITILCEKANRKDIKFIFSLVAHIKNAFKGLQDDFVYKLEVCNVHFPMTVKIDGDSVVISNFLGEKRERKAGILAGAKVEISGKDILVSSQDIEKAGQTAANIEKATRVRAKDRRIFQDGIFITEKPKGAI